MLNIVDVLKKTHRKPITLSEVHDETSPDKIIFQELSKGFFHAKTEYSAEAWGGKGREVSQIKAIKTADQGYPTERPLSRPQPLSGGGLAKKGLKRKGGERERGERSDSVFIPPSDLLFCAVNEQ